MSEQHPWLRQEHETDKAYQGFSVYCLLGPERSIKRAWEAIRGRERDGKNAPRDFEQWSSDYAWTARVAAYDAWVSQFAIAQDAEYSRKIVNKARNTAIKCIEKMDELIAPEKETVLAPTLRDLSGALNALVAAVAKLAPYRSDNLRLEDALPVVLKALLEGEAATLQQIMSALSALVTPQATDGSEQPSA